MLPTLRREADTANDPEAFVSQFVSEYKESFPVMTTVLAIGQIIPVASVSCERAFSCQNRIKSKFRSRLKNSTLQGLMLVATSEHCLESFDFSKAIRTWSQSQDDPASEPEAEVHESESDHGVEPVDSEEEVGEASSDSEVEMEAEVEEEDVVATASHSESNSEVEVEAEDEEDAKSTSESDLQYEDESDSDS